MSFSLKDTFFTNNTFQYVLFRKNAIASLEERKSLFFLQKKNDFWSRKRVFFCLKKCDLA